MREQETDRVLIVGGGPVGLVLALVLARHGAGSLVLEARPAPTPAEESRAITWMPRGLELLGWLGLAERFRERGLARHAHQFRARSTVRRQLAVPARHRDYGAHSAVADFELADPADPAESFVDLDPARPWGCSASPLGAGGSSTGSTPARTPRPW